MFAIIRKFSTPILLVLFFVSSFGFVMKLMSESMMQAELREMRTEKEILNNRNRYLSEILTRISAEELGMVPRSSRTLEEIRAFSEEQLSSDRDSRDR